MTGLITLMHWYHNSTGQCTF